MIGILLRGIDKLIGLLLRPLINARWRQRVIQPLKGCVRLLAEQPGATAASAGSADYQDVSTTPQLVGIHVPVYEACHQPTDAGGIPATLRVFQCGLKPDGDRGVILELQFNATLAYPAMGPDGGAIASATVKVAPGALSGMDVAQVSAGGHRWQGSPSLVGAWTDAMVGVNPCTGSLEQGMN